MSKQQANLVCLLVAAIWGGGFIATDAVVQRFLGKPYFVEVFQVF